MVKKSKAWKYFQVIDKDSARCNIEDCPSIISTKSSSTKGLLKHLERLHGISLDGSEETQPPAKRQRTIEDCMKFPSLDEAIARQICEYNLNFNQIARNVYLRTKLSEDFKQPIPAKSSNIAAHFYKFFEKVKSMTIDRIRVLRENGKKFSCTLDEWTSGANKRYLNINLHYVEEDANKYINLGLIPIKGKCDAEKLKNLVSCSFGFYHFHAIFIFFFLYL